MKKKIFQLIMILIIFITFTGCSKVVTEDDYYNQIYGELEGTGKFIQINSISEKIMTFPYESYFRFYPFEYKNGVVKGIISNQHKDFGINYNQSVLYSSASPILYKEYAASLNGNMEETGEIIDPVSRSDIEDLKLSDPYLIKLRDNSNNKEYCYKIEKDLGLKYRDDGVLINLEGTQVDKSVNIDIINNRYKLIRVIYQKLKEVDFDVIAEITIIFDKENDKFYQGEIDYSRYGPFSGLIKEINNELYSFKEEEGEIFKLTLDNGRIKEEKYLTLSNKEGEIYYFNGVIGNNEIGYSICFDKCIKQSESIANQVEQGMVNINTKKVYLFDKVLEESIMYGIEGSDNLVLMHYYTNPATEVWICKIDENRIVKVQMIAKYTSNGISMENPIENLLYDREANSFFIKRLLSNYRDEYKSYSYEILKLGK